MKVTITNGKYTGSVSHYEWECINRFQNINPGEHILDAVEDYGYDNLGRVLDKYPTDEQMILWDELIKETNQFTRINYVFRLMLISEEDTNNYKFASCAATMGVKEFRLVDVGFTIKEGDQIVPFVNVVREVDGCEEIIYYVSEFNDLTKVALMYVVLRTNKKTSSKYLSSELLKGENGELIRLCVKMKDCYIVHKVTGQEIKSKEDFDRLQKMK